jgi:hypothetical protein
LVAPRAKHATIATQLNLLSVRHLRKALPN